MPTQPAPTKLKVYSHVIFGGRGEPNGDWLHKFFPRSYRYLPASPRFASASFQRLHNEFEREGQEESASTRLNVVGFSRRSYLACQLIGRRYASKSQYTFGLRCSTTRSARYAI